MLCHDVNGLTVMMNDKEADFWIKTGNYKRIPEGDDADEDYINLRDKMFSNGDDDYYRWLCPPKESTPPYLISSTNPKTEGPRDD